MSLSGNALMLQRLRVCPQRCKVTRYDLTVLLRLDDKMFQLAARGSLPMDTRTLSGTGMGRWEATSIQTILTSP